jgi:hypothetical protein
VEHEFLFAHFGVVVFSFGLRSSFSFSSNNGEVEGIPEMEEMVRLRRCLSEEFGIRDVNKSMQ